MTIDRYGNGEVQIWGQAIETSVYQQQNLEDDAKITLQVTSGAGNGVTLLDIVLGSVLLWLQITSKCLHQGQNRIS